MKIPASQKSEQSIAGPSAPRTQAQTQSTNSVPSQTRRRPSKRSIIHDDDDDDDDEGNDTRQPVSTDAEKTIKKKRPSLATDDASTHPVDAARTTSPTTTTASADSITVATEDPISSVSDPSRGPCRYLGRSRRKEPNPIDTSKWPPYVNPSRKTAGPPDQRDT